LRLRILRTSVTGLLAATALTAMVACAPAAGSTTTPSSAAKPTGAATTASGALGGATTTGGSTTTAGTTGGAAGGSTTTAGTTGGATTTSGATGTRPAAASTTTSGTTGAGTTTAGTTGASSGTPGAVSAAVGTTTALAPIAFAGAKLDPTDPQLMLRNSGASAMNLAGWKLRVGSATAAMPSTAQIGPGDTVIIHFGPGTTSAKDWYLASEAASLMPGLRPGARVQLENAQGNVVSDFALPG
jgi:hypothetical protein